MHEIAIFCEDSGHEKVITGLMRKILPQPDYTLRVLSTRHGKGRALSELRAYLVQIKRGLIPVPDAVVAAIDANCKGYNEKRKEIDSMKPGGFPNHIPFIYAIPDPHIERWILHDSSAFKAVFGKGCDAPDQKCEKDRYKDILNHAIFAAGGEITISWTEHAEALLEYMDFEALCRVDDSVKKFIDECRLVFTILERRVR
jgi:hypothetical protein